MGYITRPEDESPLWRRYMDELDGMGPAEHDKWTKSVDLGTPFPSMTTSAYYGTKVEIDGNEYAFSAGSEEELDRLVEDKRNELRSEKRDTRIDDIVK